MMLDHIFDRCLPEPNTGCWLWTGRAERNGYGVVACKRGGKRSSTTAHRVSYELHCGPIPDGMDVMHKCDTPACVNPDHLVVGTTQDNMRDMVAKGRNVCMRGERASNAKLTDEAVRDIRSRRKMGVEYARQYGVTNALVSLVQRRKAWAHVV